MKIRGVPSPPPPPLLACASSFAQKRRSFFQFNILWNASFGLWEWPALGQKITIYNIINAAINSYICKHVCPVPCMVQARLQRSESLTTFILHMVFKPDILQKRNLETHCKKRLLVFPVFSRDVTYSRPMGVWSVTSRPGTGKPRTFFYSAGAF